MRDHIIASLLVSVPAFALAAPASAQSAGASQQAAPAADPANSTDIIVTATKQSTTLQRTPAAITAISGANLAATGVVDVRGLEQFVPAVRLQQENQATEVYIRGVGLTLDIPEVDPPNAINFNGVYVPREASAVAIYDVAQAEVLPGPQGTLYGRGSLGGVVNINFNRPTQNLSANVLMEAGNYGLFHGTGVVNVPVNENLAVRAAGDYIVHSSYGVKGTTANDWSTRLSLLWTPGERFSAYVWGMASDKNGYPASSYTVNVDPLTGEVKRGAFLQHNPWNEDYPSNLTSGLVYGQPSSFEKKIPRYLNNIIAGELKYDLNDNLTLSYLGSYTRFIIDAPFNIAAQPATQYISNTQMTHELRLNGKQKWGDWLFGLYGYTYRSAQLGTISLIFNPPQSFPFTVPYIATQRNMLRGIAAYGQATVNLSDRAHLTVGGRYSADDRTGLGYPGSAGFPAGVVGQFTFAKNYSHFDYKIALNYDVAEHVMAYATLQTGFQPGTFNEFRDHPATPAHPDGDPNISNAVNPAKLTAYTAGFKARFFDGLLQVNDEVFYYDYRNLFVGTFSQTLGLTQVFNAKKVKIYGNQLDVVVKPSSKDLLSFSVAYLHARNSSFDIPPYIPSPTGRTNFNGLALQYAPDWTINASYSHDFDVKGGYIRATASTHYESAFYADFFQTPGLYQKGYTKSDASLTYFNEAGHWNLGAWIKNIENEPVIAAAASGSSYPFNPAGGGAFLQPPRTYGMRFSAEF